MKRQPFTLIQAIAIQEEHLEQWERVLKPEIAAELREWAQETNATVSSPWHIRRGVDLSHWLHNTGMQLQG